MQSKLDQVESIVKEIVNSSDSYLSKQRELEDIFHLVRVSKLKLGNEYQEKAREEAKLKREVSKELIRSSLPEFTNWEDDFSESYGDTITGTYKDTALKLVFYYKSYSNNWGVDFYLGAELIATSPMTSPLEDTIGWSKEYLETIINILSKIVNS